MVSMPSLEIFEAQDPAYRESVLPQALDRRLAIEAGATSPWYRLVGSRGGVLGIDRFGLSGPGEAVYGALGFTVEAVVTRSQALLGRA